MSRSPSPYPDLEDVLLGIRSSLDSLGERIHALEAAARPPAVVAVTSGPTPMSLSTPSTKGKARAQAAPAPSKAKPAKKERPTKKTSIPSDTLPLHLAQTFPQEGKPDRHLVTVAIPDATAAHVIGQGGKGLKQLHDISGARVSAYTLTSGPRDERHVSIRGTDEQIGDALVVLGKRLARKRIHAPKSKKTVAASPSTKADLPPPAATPRAPLSASTSGSRPSITVSAPLYPLPPAPGSSAARRNPPSGASGWGAGPLPPATLSPRSPLHPSPTTQHVPLSRSQSMGEQPVSRGPSYTPSGPPTVVMASPLPPATASVPTVVMASPSPSGSVTPASPMDIGAAVTATPRPQTARRGSARRGRGT